MKVTIAKAGAIKPLVALARTGNAGGKEQGKAALQNLASGNEDNRRAMQGMGYSV